MRTNGLSSVGRPTVGGGADEADHLRYGRWSAMSGRERLAANREALNAVKRRLTQAPPSQGDVRPQLRQYINAAIYRQRKSSGRSSSKT